MKQIVAQMSINVLIWYLECILNGMELEIKHDKRGMETPSNDHKKLDSNHDQQRFSPLNLWK